MKKEFFRTKVSTLLSVFLTFISFQFVFATNFDITPIPYDSVEVKPSFHGEGGFLQHIFNNLRYPVGAINERIQGVAHIRFVIDRDGGIVELETINDIHPLLSREAMRVIRILPLWTPGRGQNEFFLTAVPVPVLMEAKIHFVLAEPDTLLCQTRCFWNEIIDSTNIEVKVFAKLPERRTNTFKRLSTWGRIKRFFGR